MLNTSFHEMKIALAIRNASIISFPFKSKFTSFHDEQGKLYNEVSRITLDCFIMRNWDSPCLSKRVMRAIESENEVDIHVFQKTALTRFVISPRYINKKI